jgi:alcohol dehydrogenase
MVNFEFQNKTRIIFGRGTENNIGREIKKYTGKTLFLHYGDGVIERLGLYQRVVDSLKAAGVEYVELTGIKPNPELGKVKEGIALCRKHNAGFILAVGGGSVIDTAKGIAAGVPYDGDLWDFFEGKAGIVEKAVPTGVIVTLPASGSETSTGTVITKEEGKYKRFIDSNELRPQFAILDPEITLGIPPFLTACGVVDIISHTMEKYFTLVKHTDFIDRLCEGLMRSMIYAGRKVMQDPGDYDARGEIMLAASFSHNGYLDCGRIADWASHIIEHEISALYDVTHAAGLSVIIPAWMRYAYKADVNRFVQYAVRVWDVDMEYGSLEEIALEGIRRTENFYKELGMPTRLKELKVDDKKFDEMASKATEGGTVGSFMKLGKDDVIKILQMAL